MRGASSQPRRPLHLAGVGVALGLLVYLLPLYGAISRPAPGGAADRTPGILFARHRQAHLDAAADHRPVRRSFAPAVVPDCPPVVTAAEPDGCPMTRDARHDRVSRSPSAGSPRSPPVL